MANRYENIIIKEYTFNHRKIINKINFLNNTGVAQDITRMCYNKKINPSKTEKNVVYYA